VKAMLRQAIQACRRAGKYVGSDGRDRRHLDFARWLVQEGIESLSSPDTVVDTWLQLSREAARRPKAKVAAG